MPDKHSSSWKMKKKVWFLLLALYIIYLLLGAAVFMMMESKREEESRIDLLKLRIEVNEFLRNDECHKNSTGALLDLISHMSQLSGVEFYREYISSNSTVEDEEDPWVWSYYNSFFFAFTVITTIGYGHMAPGTWQGRVFCIFYALIGIPLNGILLASLGEFFAAVLVDVHKKSKFEKTSNSKGKKKWLTSPRKISLWTEVLFYLIPGFIVFIFIPAVGFVLLEDWTFIEGVYYAFVTLTTIGFGDLVARGKRVGGWVWVYNAFVVCWIMFGLGYLIMILGFIGRAYQSKRLISFEKKFREGLKATSQRISQGVTKEAKDFRRLINTIQMLKVKPVYTNHPDHRATMPPNMHLEFQGRQRSKSVSMVKIWDDHLNLQQPQSIAQAQRRKSEAELIDIDKEKTFRNMNEMEAEQPISLLLQLASTLVHANAAGSSEADHVDIARRMEQLESARGTPDIRVCDVESGVIENDVETSVEDIDALGSGRGVHQMPHTSAGIQLVKALASRMASDDAAAAHRLSFVGRSGSRASNVSQDRPEHQHELPRFMIPEQSVTNGAGRLRPNVTVYDLLSATNIIMEADASVWERKVRENKASLKSSSPSIHMNQHVDPRETISRQLHRLASYAHFPNFRWSHKPPWNRMWTDEEAALIEQRRKAVTATLSSMPVALGEDSSANLVDNQPSPSFRRRRFVRSISEPSGHHGSRQTQTGDQLDGNAQAADERNVSFYLRGS